MINLRLGQDKEIGIFFHQQYRIILKNKKVNIQVKAIRLVSLQLFKNDYPNELLILQHNHKKILLISQILVLKIVVNRIVL